MGGAAQNRSPTSSELETTSDLLARVRAGDGAARERLVARYLPILRRWAHGRLPFSARGLADTDDLVQVTLLRALDRVEEFEPRREGAFLAYLRSILLNAIRYEIWRSVRLPGGAKLGENVADPEPSPLEQAIGRDLLDSYETALATLPEDQQEAVILRVEFGFTHEEIAAATGSPSANAARMRVSRALVRLAEALDERR